MSIQRLFWQIVAYLTQHAFLVPVGCSRGRGNPHWVNAEGGQVRRWLRMSAEMRSALEAIARLFAERRWPFEVPLGAL